ncbi:MAG: UDP-glucose 4-epimerase GalE [bacterium]
MRALVVGGAGYIGSVTTEVMIHEGIEVVVFDNLSRGHRSAVHPKAKFIRGDLSDKDGITRVLKSESIDSIVHFAAYSLVGESMEAPNMYFRNNVACTVNLLEAMREAGVKKIVFSSTAAVYGEPNEVPISEDAPTSPKNPYGASKLMIEEILRWNSVAYGVHYTALRYFNAAGASENFGEDHDPETHLIPLILDVALGKRDAVEIFGTDYPTPDGTAIRDYIHVVDLARAHVLALRDGRNGTYNLGNGEGYSVREVVEAAERVTGRPIPTREIPRRPGDPAKLVASSKRIKEELGWKPQWPNLEDILNSAWEWRKRFPNGYED